VSIQSWLAKFEGTDRETGVEFQRCRRAAQGLAEDDGVVVRTQGGGSRGGVSDKLVGLRGRR